MENGFTHASFQLKRENVKSVYNGRPGCMCGCRGKWSYPNRDIEAAGKARGYALDAEDISERSVAFVVNKINNNLLYARADVGGAWVEFQSDGRVYVAYLTH